MKKLTALLAFFVSLFILIYSCSKDEISNGGSGSGNQFKTTISGMVLDENNSPQNGVAVSAYGETTTTNQYGVFVLKDVSVNKSRCVVQFSKAGFFDRAHAFIPTANSVNYVRIVLLSNAQTHTVSAAAGGAVSLTDGSSVQFAPNSFVTSNGTAYTGTVGLTIKHLSPDDVNFGFMIPGGDLAGTNANEEDVVLYTYGMLGVELKGSSGEQLQLVTGTTATLKMTIATSQTATAPATIPLWYFDEATSLWKEEGTANKVGNNYLGTVTHFSWWNCDYPGPKAAIKGKVVDCEGIPMPNVVVTVNDWATTLTDQNGLYQNWVPVGLTLPVQVLSFSNPGILTSQLENIPALSIEQTFIVADLIIPCPSRIIGTIQSCSGENIEGVVSVSDGNGFRNFQFTSNGSFNLVTIPNAQINLDASNINLNAYYYQILTSLSAPNVLNIGNILLCDTLFSTDNSFYVSDCPLLNNFSYNYIPINPNSFGGSINNFLQAQIVDSSGTQILAIVLGWGDTLSGTFTASNFNMSLRLNGNYFSDDSGTMHIHIGNVGEYIYGDFDGQYDVFTTTGIWSLARVRGHFKFPRY